MQNQKHKLRPPLTAATEPVFLVERAFVRKGPIAIKTPRVARAAPGCPSAKPLPAVHAS